MRISRGVAARRAAFDLQAARQRHRQRRPGRAPQLACHQLKGTGIRLTGATVHDDGVADVLTGSSGSGLDWFFYHRGLNADTLSNRKPGDAYTLI
jgi:hypothetical protein